MMAAWVGGWVMMSLRRGDLPWVDQHLELGCSSVVGKEVVIEVLGIVEKNVAVNVGRIVVHISVHESHILIVFCNRNTTMLLKNATTIQKLI